MTQKLTTQELLKKHHFWIVLGVGAVLVPLGLWFYGVSNLKAMTETERRAREQWHSRVNSLRPAAHPNNKFTEIVLNVQNVNSGHVFDGWSMRYNAQKDLVEKWPSWLTADYQQQIRECIKEGKPIPSPIRQAYLNRIEEEFPKLLREKIAGNLRRPVQDQSSDMQPGRQTSGAAAAPGAPGRRSSGRFEGLVAWDAGERQRLANKLGGSWTTPPTHEQMIYTQETLNIYEALIEHIINKANMDEQGRIAPEHHQATIKKIQALLIGRDAEPLPIMGGAAATVDSPDASADPSSGGEQQSQILSGSRSGNRMTEDSPPDGKLRFVDANGKPVPDQKAAPPFAEFRMLPVTMQLVMDHRRIPELLALCANSPLPLEVRQVNVRSVRGDGSPTGGSGRQSMSGGDASMGPRRPSTTPTTSQLDAEVELGPTDMMVEIRGVIYLFNAPDRALIGTGTAGDEADGEAVPPEGEILDGPTPEGPSPAGEAPAGPSPEPATPAPQQPAPGGPAPDGSPPADQPAEPAGIN